MEEINSAYSFEDIHRDLYRLARRMMKGERPNHTLQPTALLGEAWIKAFADHGSLEGLDRNQLIAKAVWAMRYTLIDHARRRAAVKRGGNLTRVPLDDVIDRCEASGVDVVELGDALEELGKVHPRPALAFTMRFIAGLGVEEIAAQLDVCSKTVRKEVNLARAWLRRKLEGGS